MLEIPRIALTSEWTETEYETSEEKEAVVRVSSSAQESVQGSASPLTNCSFELRVHPSSLQKWCESVKALVKNELWCT